MSTVADLPSSYRFLNPRSGAGFAGGWSSDGNGRRSALIVQFPWEDAAAGMEAIAGTPELISGVYLRRVPLQNPFFTDQYAIDYRHVGIGNQGAISNSRLYSHVNLEVQFERPRFGLEGDDAFTSYRWLAGTQMITIPNSHFVTTTTGEVVEQNVGVPIGSLGIEISRHWVADQTAALAALATADLFGATNDATFTIRGMSFAAGTLMFPSASSDVRIPLDGEVSATLSIVMQYRRLPWNSVINRLGNADVLIPAPIHTADFDVIHTL